MNRKLKEALRCVLPATIKDHRILGGPLRGNRIVTSWHDYPTAIMGRTELPLIRWFKENVNPNDTWLDIGAHYGYTAIALSRLVGSRGRVFAFEPMLSTAGYLSQTRLHNHLKQLNVIPLALGNTQMLEIHELLAVRGMVDSTLETIEGTGKHSGWSEKILITRLDWLWPKICGQQSQINGVKIDVQGMEIETLRGMLNVLKSCRPELVLEVHQGVDRNELLDLIEISGYSLNATPIQSISGEAQGQYIDNMSYAFSALPVKT